MMCDDEHGCNNNFSVALLIQIVKIEAGIDSKVICVKNNEFIDLLSFCMNVT